MPSPSTWLTVPSKRCTASIMCSITGSRMLPRLLDVAVGEELHRALEVGEEHGDLLALAFERAPSTSGSSRRDAWACRPRARRSGSRPARATAGAACPAGWPHSEQNLAVGESGDEQLAHTRASGAAHSSQNLALGAIVVAALGALHVGLRALNAREWGPASSRRRSRARPPRDTVYRLRRGLAAGFRRFIASSLRRLRPLPRIHPTAVEKDRRDG